MVRLFQPHGPAHHSGLCVCHQYVSGVVISTTRPGSQLWCHCVPSACKWCGYFNHKAWPTILASLCAQGVSGVVISTTRSGSPLWPLVCHQGVSSVVISTTWPGSPLWPFCVSSVCKWCGYFNHKAWLIIVASLRAIRM